MDFMKLLKRSRPLRQNNHSTNQPTNQGTNKPTDKDWQFGPVIYTSY